MRFLRALFRKPPDLVIVGADPDKLDLREEAIVIGLTTFFRARSLSAGHSAVRDGLPGVLVFMGPSLQTTTGLFIRYTAEGALELAEAILRAAEQADAEAGAKVAEMLARIADRKG